MAGGVSSHFRMAGAPHPLFFSKGMGTRIYDVDGNEYLDFTLSQGPVILGHSHVVEERRVDGVHYLNCGCWTERPSTFVAGEVREVDLADGTITLAHGRIASLRMQPMGSMVFKADDAKSIADLKNGDKVEFRVKMVADRPTLTEIRPEGKSKK